MAVQDEKRTRSTASAPWWKKNKGMSIGGGIIALVLIIACVWLVIHPRIYGTYNGYLDGKKDVKLVINKDGQNSKEGYLQYNAASDNGRAIRRFTKSLNKNETVINEISDYLKDSDTQDLKKMMQSDLYKNYLENSKMPILVVKHNGKWYLQLDESKYRDAGFSKSDIDDMFSSISKKGKYSSDNEISFGFHKLVVGSKKENNTFYRAKYKPNDPRDWADKKDEQKSANDFNEIADELDELATMVDTLRNAAAIGEMSDILDSLDDGDSADSSALDDDQDEDDADSSIDDDDAEDVNYVPVFQRQQLVFE